ncbi:hypothetical protein PQX77_007936 [Marasmius sp. AFHP31]|nr:hypothetical protein PQX77_007936 [Marasmius sp. AFHP31]
MRLTNPFLRAIGWTNHKKNKQSEAHQENSTPPRSSSRRHRRPTDKAAYTEGEQAERVKEAERKKQRRKELCAQEEQLVQHRDDSDEVRELKERALAAEAQARAAQEEVIRMKTAEANSPSAITECGELIPRPRNLSNVKVEDLRRHLKLEGRKNKSQWSRIRVDEAAPLMRRFKNQWGTEFLAREFFSTHKTYKNCANNPSPYCGRIHEARLGSSRSPSSGPDPSTPRSQTPVPPVASTSTVTLDCVDGEHQPAEENELIDGDLPDLSSDEDDADRDYRSRSGKGKGKTVERRTGRTRQN